MGRHRAGTVGEYVEVDKSFTDQRAGEGHVFLAARHELGDNAVMRVQAQPAPRSRAWRGEGDYPVSPAFREDGRGDADALGVEAERLVERRKLADRRVDHGGLRVIGV